MFLDEYWSLHPELQDIPIYYASSLAKKCMAVYQTYINAMNDRIRRQIAVNNPFVFRHISNLKVSNTVCSSFTYEPVGLSLGLYVIYCFMTYCVFFSFASLIGSSLLIVKQNQRNSYEIFSCIYINIIPTNKSRTYLKSKLYLKYHSLIAFSSPIAKTSISGFTLSYKCGNAPSALYFFLTTSYNDKSNISSNSFLAINISA